jgi:membrane protein insertase Oxa1/YidC/SpoIIIJ
MLFEIWNTFLFQPLYNVLILIYNNWTDQSLGLAIIYLTILLRVVLLPLTIMSFFNQRKNDLLDEEVRSMAKQFQHDPVLQKAEVRRLLKTRRVSPWAKALSLAVQGVVVLLLYEVFLFGLEGNRILDYLYPWVAYPGNINTEFLGFDIGERYSVLWAGVVAIWLFLESLYDIKKERVLEKRDLTFLFLFPGAVFAFLWYLPIMKALFFFTAMVFTFAVGLVFKAVTAVSSDAAPTKK